ncbi:putative c2h2 and c2hc zinc finger [Erysiphe necator]|uniref:Putative c2h2 and c2hc zinc finger n=1 Tax=Uncinula necator TaxID=52586 RepID=A0A0B1P9F2_UNCNE|nr:putative c2h2 and c2hc zinc finger [Erysiphe necator]
MNSIERSTIAGQSNHGASSPCINQTLGHHSSQPHLERSRASTDTADIIQPSLVVPNLSSNDTSDRRLSSTVSFTNSVASVDNPQLQKEVDLLRGVLSQTSTNAIQIVLGDQWRNLAFTNLGENSISSVCQTVLKNVNSSILEKAFRDESLFDSPIFEFLSQKRQMIIRVLQSITCEQLISFVPEPTLNKTLAERVKYVPARDLINWLASADRLGYKPDDILEDDELVIPKQTSQNLHDANQDKKTEGSNSVAHNQTKSSVEQVRNTLSGSIQVDPANTCQQAHNLIHTGLKRKEIDKPMQIPSDHQNKEPLMKNGPNTKSQQAEQSRLALIGPPNNSGITNLQKNHISDSSNLWLSSRNSQFPAFISPELAKEVDVIQPQHSIAIPRRKILPSSRSPQVFGNNLSSSPRNTVLNALNNTGNVSQSSPQLEQSTQMIPLNSSSQLAQDSSSLISQNVSISPNLMTPPGSIISFQSEMRSIDENLKKEVANIPAGISQDQRLARISSLVNLASAQKYKLGISHGVYLGIQQGSDNYRETPRLDASVQGARPLANMYGPINNHPHANSSTPASNRSSIVEGNGSSVSNIVGVDANSYSNQLTANMTNYHPRYSSPYVNSDRTQNLKRLRSESNV